MEYISSKIITFNRLKKKLADSQKGFNANEVFKSAFQKIAKDFVTKKSSVAEFKRKKYPAWTVKSMGYSAKEMRDGGYSEKSLKMAGFAKKEILDNNSCKC